MDKELFGLDNDLLAQLKSCGHEKHFARGEYLFLEDEAADCLYLIISGSVSIILEEEDGAEVVLVYLNDGDILGEVPLSRTGRERSASARARTDTTVCCIGFNHFLELAAQNHRFWLLIIHQMGRHLHHATERVKLLATMTSQQRILHMLSELCELPGTSRDGEGTEIRITREELGSIAGCSREMAGRVLRKLQDIGDIELRGHKLWIRDSARSMNLQATN